EPPLSRLRVPRPAQRPPPPGDARPRDGHAGAQAEGGRHLEPLCYALSREPPLPRQARAAREAPAPGQVPLPVRARAGDAHLTASTGHDKPHSQLLEMVDESRLVPAGKPARPHQSSVDSLDVDAGIASCVTDSLNSRIPLPSERPISGSRFAPKSRSARPRMI